MTTSLDPPFVGLLETHLTVRDDSSSTGDRLVAWEAAGSWKAIHIVLDRGAVSSQPMLSRRRQGTLAGELAAARQAGDELREAGLPVARIKIEVDARHGDAPTSDALAAASPARYFEHHVKLLLPTTEDLATLARTAEIHSAHLSRNALSRRDDGRYERFVTQRAFGVGRSITFDRLARLVAGLRETGREIVEIESEYVVYDSDRSLDAGWLPSEA